MKMKLRSRGRQKPGKNAIRDVASSVQIVTMFEGDKQTTRSSRRRKRPDPSPSPPSADLPAQDTMGRTQPPAETAESRPLDLAHTSTSYSSQHSELVLRADEDGDMPIHIAVAQEKEQMVINCINMMAELHVHVDVYNYMRQTPLHIATLTANANVTSHLLNVGASIIIPDRRGNTPVHLATKAVAHQCLDLLLRVPGPERNRALSMFNYDGFTPLHLAVFTRDTTIIRMLVERGADTNCVDGTSGRSALFHAVENNYEEVVTLLLDLGARANLPNYSGVTPLVLANERRQKTISHLLMAKGASSSESHDN